MNDPETTELIFYATPTGALAAACDRYFSDCRSRLGPTTAQTYPPHCTLTGFFRRPPDRVDAIAAEIQGIIDDAGPVPDDAVSLLGLVATDRWVGIEIDSAWLTARIEEVMRAQQQEPGDDAVRPKDWLHLSLAYGVDDLVAHRELAEDHGFATPPAGGWELALWARDADGGWRRLTTNPSAGLDGNSRG